MPAGIRHRVLTRARTSAAPCAADVNLPFDAFHHHVSIHYVTGVFRSFRALH